MSDAALKSALAGRYLIERELGGGGMSRVFVAREQALGRSVVIKLLSPDLLAGVDLDRFQREILVAARLQHPHIVPVLTAGDCDGLPYYTMPFVEGESLRGTLARRGALPIGEVVGILRDVAQALDYAHEQGIVHRDIKPDNVLLARGAATVTDFGIAKAISLSRTGAPGATLTQAGVSIGTPAYMAPEQAAGDPDVDFRADLYAFGCLAYELLAGRAPFADAATPQRVIAAHLTETPRSIIERRPNTPPSLAALVMRCLAKDPAARPATAAEVLRALESVPSGDALAFAAGRSPRTRFSRRVEIALVLLFTTLSLAGGYAFRRRAGAATAHVPTLAVLPLENHGNDSAAYFVEGLAAAISDRLAGLSGLGLIDHQSAVSVTKPSATAKEIGEALGAEYVLRGDVRWDLTSSTRRAQVSVQLINVRDGTTKWQLPKPIEFTLSDPFTVQRDVATSVAEALDVALSASDRAALADRPTKSADAYDAYLRGLAVEERWSVASELPLAANHFADAIALDPGFLAAKYRWIEVEWLRIVLSEPGALQPDSIRRVLQDMQRRGPNAAETRLGEAMYAVLTNDSTTGIAFQRALAAAPNNPKMLIHAGLAAMFVGDSPAAAWAPTERAVRLAPRNVEILLTAVQVATSLRRLDDARTWLARLLAIDADNPQAAGWTVILAALDGDSVSVLDRYNAATLAIGRPISSAVPTLIFGTAAARDTLIALPLSRVAFITPMLDSCSVYYAKALALMLRGDSASARQMYQRLRAVSTAHPLPDSWAAAQNIVEYQLLAAAGLGDGAQLKAMAARLETANQRWPPRSGARAAARCLVAEGYALMRDTTEMYPRLDDCFAGAGGLGGAFGMTAAVLQRHPAFAPFRDQPHFRQLVQTVRLTSPGR